MADGLRLSILGLLIGLHMLLSADNVGNISLPRVSAIAALSVILVAAAAAAIPALRAASVDPAVMLRAGVGPRAHSHQRGRIP